MLSYTCRSLLSYKSRISLLIFSDTSTSMSSAEHQSLGRLSFVPINLVAEQRVSFVMLTTEPTIPRYITAYAHAFAEWCRQTVVLKLLKVETGLQLTHTNDFTYRLQNSTQFEPVLSCSLRKYTGSFASASQYSISICMGALYWNQKPTYEASAAQLVISAPSAIERNSTQR